MVPGLGDFDPTSIWAAYTQPLLALFGEADRSTPVAEVISRLNTVVQTDKSRNITVKVFPEGNHLLLRGELGPSEFLLDYLETMNTWLQKHVLVAK